MDEDYWAEIQPVRTSLVTWRSDRIAKVTAGPLLPLVFVTVIFILECSPSPWISRSSCNNNGKEHLFHLFIFTCQYVHLVIQLRCLSCVLGYCCGANGRQQLKVVVRCSSTLCECFLQLCSMAIIGYTEARDSREMVSLFLWDLLMAEMAETVRVPVFSFDEVVYTSTELCFTYSSDAPILLVIKPPCLITVWGLCGTVKITWPCFFPSQLKQSENMRLDHHFNIRQMQSSRKKKSSSIRVMAIV